MVNWSAKLLADEREAASTLLGMYDDLISFVEVDLLEIDRYTAS